MSGKLSMSYRLAGKESESGSTKERQQRQKFSGSQFEFITSNGPPGKARDDAASSKRVRIQAMRHFLQEKSTSSTEIAQEQVDTTQQGRVITNAPKATTGKFKLASWSRKPRKKSVIEYQGLPGSIRTSPIVTSVVKDLGSLIPLIIPSRPLTAQLLNHC
jgi:hypothetical protein